MDGLDSPSLTVALAMLVGVLCQGLARHARVPGIVLLLAAGVLLGPDVADVVRPHNMGAALPSFVGFAVAVILFEGGLCLNIKHLRAQAKPIRRLVTTGAVVTAVGGMLCAKVFLGWEWRLAFLFGTLVIVTGPTVITPLLRRIKVDHRLEVILEAEGIFIDAVGATIAVVALEVVLAAPGETLWAGIKGISGRIAVGVAIGAIGGLALALLLRWRRVVPEGLENITGLGFAVAMFQGSNAIVHESGIIATIVAGMAVGNANSHALQHLKEFKEQLTVLLIATLFVLLAADVRLENVQALGMGGIATVIALMFIVRPLDIAATMYNTEFTLKDKAFLAWMGPRGIVAAAVASLFAQTLKANGVAGGDQMQALVFLVIATTVAVQGLSGGIVASFLGVTRPSNNGMLILGANALARAVGRELKAFGQSVELLDTAPERIKIAHEQGLDAVLGNGLDADVLAHVHADSRQACIGMTPREDTNYLFAQKILKNFRGPDAYVALETEAEGVTEAMVTKSNVKLMFGAECPLEQWIHRFKRGDLAVEHWNNTLDKAVIDIRRHPTGSALPLFAVRKGAIVFVDRDYVPRSRDVVVFAIAQEAIESTGEWLSGGGWIVDDNGETESS